jgi:capsular exopolysaccharide synthesis family protein
MDNKLKFTINRKSLLIAKGVFFEFIEAYKSLRTNLQFASINNTIKKLIVTSSIPGEGKTTIALNLAVSLTENGQKVLLVDTDFRKPQLHKYLKLESNKIGGLTTALAGLSPIESCIVYFSDLGIYVLAAGPIPPNPTELLSSAKLEELVDRLSYQYDYIIFDTPPVTVVTDAAILSRICDGVIFVLRHNYATHEIAKIAKQNLEKVDAKILGCVFNAFNVKKSNKSYKYYN